jgi:hypothetical protein
MSPSFAQRRTLLFFENCQCRLMSHNVAHNNGDLGPQSRPPGSDSCRLVLYAKTTAFSHKSQSLPCFVQNATNISCNVLFCLSTCPSHWGWSWYAVVLVFVITITSHTSCINVISTFARWSECKTTGGPKRLKTLSTGIFATVDAFWSGVGKASHYLVKWSIKINMCFLPRFVSGKGPM